MMEIFLTSARLPEILWGKLLGLGALGITQVGIWGIYVLIFALFQGNLDIGRTLASLQLTPAYLLLFVAYFLLGYLMYGAIMFAVGVSVNAEQESRQLGGVVGLVTVLPFIFIFAYTTDPGVPLPTFFSLFPLTAPSGMLLRYAWSYVSPGEIALSLALLVVFIFLVLRLAVFMFRLGALNYGKRLSIRDLLSNLRYGVKQA